MLQRVTEMPTSGQFIVMWEYNNLPWACVYRILNDSLYKYDDNGDAYVLASPPHFDNQKIWVRLTEEAL